MGPANRIRHMFRFQATLLVLTIVLTDRVNCGVSSFRVYDEGRILDRLASAPVVSFRPETTLSHRAGTLTSSRPSPTSPSTTIAGRRRVRQQNGNGNGNGRRRIRKVVKRLKTAWNSEPWRSSTPPMTDLLGAYGQNDDLGLVNSQPYQASTPDLSNVQGHWETSMRTEKSVRESSSSPAEDNRSVEQYLKRRRPSKPVPADPDSDLQIGESFNGYNINGSAPISSDFRDSSGPGGGLQFKLQILHPLLNSDSVLTQGGPRVPENKTIGISHVLSEEIGEVPVAPDLKSTFRLRKKHPLLNQDSIISSEVQISKNSGGQFHHEVSPASRSRSKMSSKIKQSVTIVEAESPHSPRPSTTTFPPVTAQVLSSTTGRTRSTSVGTTYPSTTTRRRTTSTTTTPPPTRRPTIRLTNPPTVLTTTTTQRPSTVILSPVTYPVTTTTEKPRIDQDRESQLGSPQVILFPPEGHEEYPSPVRVQSGNNKPSQVPAPISSEQEILNQLFGLGQVPQQGQTPSSTQSLQDSLNQLLGLGGGQGTSQGQPPTTTPSLQDSLNQLLGLGQVTPTTTPSIQDNLSQLFGLGQVTPQSQSPSTPQNNLFDLFNLFQPSTTAPTTTTRPTTRRPTTTTTTTEASTTQAQPPKVTPSPGKTEAELENLLQLAIFDGLIKANGGKATGKPTNLQAAVDGLSDSDLKSIYTLIDNQGKTTSGPATTAAPSLQSALSNMLSLLTNPFGQQQQQQQNIFGQQQQQQNIFGQAQQPNLNLFGQPQQNSNLNLFGQPQQNNPLSNLFGLQGQRPQPSLFGGNSLFNFNLNSEASSTTEAVVGPVYKHPTTPGPVSSTPAPRPTQIAQDSELFNQLLQLGLAVDQQGKQNHLVRSTPQPPQQPALDIQSILAGNWLGGLGGAAQHQPRPQAEVAPSETMTLLNILFNQNKPQTQRTTGPYWWLDMNTFLGGNPSSDPMAGIRPKLGQKDYFLKVTR